jgi:hypothetical protein
MNLPRYADPDTITTRYDTNALGLLGAAIRDAVIRGEMAKADHYTDNLFFAGAFETPKGYGGSLEFNTPTPYTSFDGHSRDRYKWKVGMKIPIDF